MIVVHCTATPEGRHHTAADIDRWHKQRGWRMIGYHWLVQLDGTIERGRPEKQQGAHVKGHNKGTIGVVYVGGCDADMKPKDTRTDEQKRALRCLLIDIKRRCPTYEIVGHCDLDSGKACPSFDVRAEYAGITGEENE